MKKVLLLSAGILIVTATPALAKENGNKTPENGKLNEQAEIKDTGKECNPDDQWKNHGEYVSCVARLHLGSATTSAAAKSDIGKKEAKEKETEDNGNEISPTAAPSGTLTPTPTSTISATPTPVSTESAQLLTEKAQALTNELNGVITFLNNVLASLKSLL